MSIFEHISRHFDGFRHHISKLLCDLIGIERERSKQIELIDKKLNALHQDNLDERRLIRAEFSEALAKLEKIYAAVVPEIVVTVKLTDESGDNTMDVQVGVPRQLKVEEFGASGNPTVPVGAATLNSTNTTDFSVDSGALTLTPTGATGATTDATATVDGVTSAPLTYTIGQPPAEPVASVVLSDVTPA